MNIEHINLLTPKEQETLEQLHIDKHNLKLTKEEIEKINTKIIDLQELMKARLFNLTNI
jgi:peptidoglycan hydrolase CwlO-like protein